MEQKNIEEMTLEEGFLMLDQITNKLDEPGLSLEERFEHYKKGMELVKSCSEKIDLVEKKMMIIQADGTKREEN